MRITFLLIAIIGAFGLAAQSDTILLSNPSFEDVPRKGGEYYGIKGWYDCGIINFPDESPPDIHPKDFWSNTKHASDGKTYLGMVVRDNDTWESVSQRLPQSMKAGECYSFSVQLSQSERYISGSRFQKENNGDDRQDYNYNTPAVFRVWGGSGYCNTKELLGETIPIKHSKWETYSFKFEPSFNHRYIIFEAFYKVPVIIPYNGHILIDNCSGIVKIDCEEEIIAQVEETKLPPHKRFKKRNKKKEKETSTEVKKETNPVIASSKATKKILNLDRNKLKKGQTIELKKLYFQADVASINTSESLEVLEEVYDFLNNNRDISIEVGGHTNGQPSHAYCDKLSQDRAKEVAEYLVKSGIDGDRIYYKGYGKRKARASNLTKEGRAKNQRVEIKILSIG